MTRVDTGLGGDVVTGERPRPRGFARPERLELPLDTLPGVGSSLAKKLRPLGLETVGDLLLRRPRRYEAAADEIAISELWGDEETVIAGVVRSARSRRLGGRRSLVTATIARRDRRDLRLVVQPALDPRSPQAGHDRAAARQARPLRLRRQVVRRRGGARDRRLRTGLRRERGGAVVAAARADPRRAHRARARRARPAAGRARAAAAARRALRAALPRRRGGGRGGAEAARARRAARAAARGAALARRGRGRGAARRARRPRRALPRRAPVPADRAPGARDRRDRPRPGAGGADAAAAPGRRRLRQDGRRALRAAARGRDGSAGRAHGADGNPR